MGTNGTEQGDKLHELFTCMGRHFSRPEVRRHAQQYICGLLSSGGRKTTSGIAARVGETNPDALGRLLTTAQWSMEGVMGDLIALIDEYLGSRAAVLVLVRRTFVKRGLHSAGARRIDSTKAAQDATFLAYVAPQGCALLDRALRLPQEWRQDHERCRKAHVPSNLSSQTDTQLARAMLERALAAHVKALWIVGSAHVPYGSNEGLRQWLQDEGRAYALPIRPTDNFTFGEDERQVRDLFKHVVPLRPIYSVIVDDETHEDWRKTRLGHQSKNKNRYATWLVERSVKPKPIHWPYAGPPSEVTYYRVYAPEHTTIEEMATRISADRQAEANLSLACERTGLDHYEVRRWDAWHRHVTLCLIAHAYLELSSIAVAVDAGSALLR